MWMQPVRLGGACNRVPLTVPPLYAIGCGRTYSRLTNREWQMRVTREARQMWDPLGQGLFLSADLRRLAAGPNSQRDFLKSLITKTRRHRSCGSVAGRAGRDRTYSQQTGASLWAQNTFIRNWKSDFVGCLAADRFAAGGNLACVSGGRVLGANTACQEFLNTTLAH